MAAKAKTRPVSIDAYLARLNPAQRAALHKLRKAVHAAAPGAEECISYSLPAFRLDGRVLVCFGASANHCSFFPGSGTTVAEHADLLKGYDTSKGTIRFPPENPLPASLVRTIVKARIAENAQRAGKPVSKWPAVKRAAGGAAAAGAVASRSKTGTRTRTSAAARTVRAGAGGGQTDGEVSAYLAKLDHPLKSELEALRRLILGVSPAVREGIKWNSLSFRTSEWFATINVCGAGRPPRPKEPPSLRMILHTGAKPTAAAKTGLQIIDSQELLKWLGKDRAMVTIHGAADLRSKQTALLAIFRDWVGQI